MAGLLIAFLVFLTLLQAVNFWFHTVRNKATAGFRRATLHRSIAEHDKLPTYNRMLYDFRAWPMRKLKEKVDGE